MSVGLLRLMRESQRQLFAVRLPLAGGEDPGNIVLFLGEDNPQSARPAHQLLDYPPNCAGHRLRGAILRVPSDAYLSCWRGNLCTPAWSERQAAETAAHVFDGEAPWRVVVMLGRKVARVMAGTRLVPDMPPFARRTRGDLTFVSLPHPSGRCRDWNDAKSYERALAAIRAAAPALPWGSEPWI